MIRDEEERQFREKWRRQLNPTLAEARGDFQAQQIRALVSGRLSGETAATGSSPASFGATEAMPTIRQPAGSSWPHTKGKKWMEAERAALFLMRHRDQVSDEELVRIAGVSRQRINELIGGTNAPRELGNIKAKDGWTPSAELLTQCGAALQPLHTAVAVLTAA